MRRFSPRLGVFRRLRRDRSGATIVEFAVVFPAFLLLIFGTIESALIIFIGSSIEAAVLEASRFGITNAQTPGVSREDRVRAIVEDKTYGLLDMDLVELETLVYQSFADIGKPEPFTDVNTNDHYDDDEPYIDVNGNGAWDEDLGEAGLGGPSDVVVYRVSYDWGVITPMIQEVIGTDVRHVSSVAVRNEPE